MKYKRVCGCGVRFVAHRKDKVWCSSVCRAKGNRIGERAVLKGLLWDELQCVGKGKMRLAVDVCVKVLARWMKEKNG